MDNLLASKSCPPGVRFHPTDEELFMYYLKKKVSGKPLPQMISELDVYRFGPWDLPSMSLMKTRDLNWYFFCPRLKKYASGGRTNRTTEHGYWKSTGNDRTVKSANRPVGKIKTLIFHAGKPPRGVRTDWVMHEYRLEDKVLADKGIVQDTYVIYKVYKKSGLGPKNGENYGAPFVEYEWESDDEENVGTVSSLVPHPIAEEFGVVNNQNTSVITNTLQTLDTVDASTPSIGQLITSVGDTQNIDATPLPIAPVETEEDELDRMLAMFVNPSDGTNEMLNDDIFDGLDDIAEAYGFNSSQAGVDWSQDFAENGDDGFMELNDLS